MRTNKKYIIGFGVLIILFVGFLALNKVLFSDIKLKEINESGFQANYYTPDTCLNKTAIVLLGGGQWGDYWAELFAQKGYLGLSLPYTRKPGLPNLPEEIPLEYFEAAMNWLSEQQKDNPKKIIVMGASRNAELALILASLYTEQVSGVIAYAPSSVSWSNTVLPFNSDSLKPSWTYKGQDVSYVPMAKISGSDSNLINTLNYWKEGLKKNEDVDKAIIKVENINGPILLISGKDDKVWPSAIMANMLEERINENNFKYDFENIQYEDAGHLVSSNPDASWEERTGDMNISGENYKFEYGGTFEGDKKAKQEAKIKVLQFIEKVELLKK